MPLTLLNPLRSQTSASPCTYATNVSTAKICDTITTWLQTLDEALIGRTKPKMIIKAATSLHQGSLLLELDSAELAKCFRFYMITYQDLAGTFRPGAVISNQSHRLVFRFVPCNSNFNPANPCHIRNLEADTVPNPCSITSMNWCRPVDKHALNQLFANTTVVVTSPTAGDHLLQESVYMRNKRRGSEEVRLGFQKVSVGISRACTLLCCPVGQTPEGVVVVRRQGASTINHEFSSDSCLRLM